MVADARSRRAAAAVPQIGPASPTRASCLGSIKAWLSRTTAPSPGMNKGAGADAVPHQHGH